MILIIIDLITNHLQQTVKKIDIYCLLFLQFHRSGTSYIYSKPHRIIYNPTTPPLRELVPPIKIANRKS